MVSKCFRLREARYISSPTCQCTQAQEQTVMVSTHTRADCVHGGLRAVSQHARAVSTNADAMQVCAPGSPPSPCGFAREAAAGQSAGSGVDGVGATSPSTKSVDFLCQPRLSRASISVLVLLCAARLAR